MESPAIPGRFKELRSALLVVHLLLIPIKPSQYDLWSLAKMAVLVDDARTFNHHLSALATINLASPHPRVSEVDEAKITCPTTSRSKWPSPSCGTA